MNRYDYENLLDNEKAEYFATLSYKEQLDIMPDEKVLPNGIILTYEKDYSICESVPLFKFKTEPFAHQLKAFNDLKDKEFLGLFMDMGTGKTKVSIDTAAYLYSRNSIDAVVVVAPNGVHQNWVLNEIPVHMPDHIDYKAHFYVAASSSTKKQCTKWEAVFKHPGLKIFCFNVESASNKKGQDELRLCVQTGRVLFIVDESQRIKTPGAKRTQFLVNLARHAEFRRILSGSPITQSPLDLYAQCKFLDPHITGYTTYTAFRSHYANIEQRRSKATGKGGRPIYYDHVDSYKNIDELEHRVSQHCFRVLKSDCLDLPDKVFEKVYVELTAQQKRVYKELLDKSVAALTEECNLDIPRELQGAPKEQLMLFFATSKVTAKNAMTKILRLQQVICGSLPDDEGEVTILDNNRLKVLQERVEDITGKVIIWARFRYDLKMIADMLTEQYGADSLAQFHGSVKKEHRMEGVRRFQEDPKCRFFLSQQHSGGTGLTLTAASDVIYYSNDFSAEARWQSEDRAHRIGQKNNVTYHDMIAQDTVDEKILEALRNKKLTADAFNYGATQDQYDMQKEQDYTNYHNGTYEREMQSLTEKQETEFDHEMKQGIAFEDDEWSN